MDLPAQPAATVPFAGWRAVRAAFLVAAFGWGVGFYGPPVFLFAVHDARGWPIPLVSAAVTCHFLLGAVVVGNLARLHRRFGVARITGLGGVLSGLGVLGWALAASPWQLFLATFVSGTGWAMTGAAAINAIVAPWFIRRRPAALNAAFNGASVGGVVLSPLWVALIAGFGFPVAAGVIGGAMALSLCWLAAGRLAADPARLGQYPDGEPSAAPIAPRGDRAAPALTRPWSEWRFVSLALGGAIGLFAQVGLIAHLLSMLVAPLGATLAGLVAGMMTVCAIIGRIVAGWLLHPGVDRRVAAAVNFGLQMLGSALMLAGTIQGEALLLAGIALFGLGLGNVISLPPLIAQADFAPADTARVVALVTAVGQAVYAFAPGGFGLLRAIDPALLFLAAAGLQGIGAAVLLLGRRAAPQR